MLARRSSDLDGGRRPGKDGRVKLPEFGIFLSTVFASISATVSAINSLCRRIFDSFSLFIDCRMRFVTLSSDLKTIPNIQLPLMVTTMMIRGTMLLSSDHRKTLTKIFSF